VRLIPSGWSLSLMMAGTIANVTTGQIRFAALSFACVVLMIFVLINLPVTTLQNRYWLKNPFVWAVGAYASIILQDLFLGGAHVQAIIWTLPMFVLIASAVLLWQQGFVLHPKDLRTGLYGFFAAGVLLGVFSSSATNPCREDKCSALGSLYQGAFPHENTMGYAASIAFIALFTSANNADRRYRWGLRAVAVIPLAAAVFSGARIAMAGVVVAFVVDRVLRAFRRRSFPTAAFSAAVVCSSVYLIYTSEVEDFSFRGRRWIVLRDSLSDFPIFGNGVTAWDDLQSSFLLDTTTHSVYGSLLVHGGLLALALFAVFISRIAVFASISTQQEILPLWVFLMVQSVFYSIWEPAQLPTRGWVLVVIALAVRYREFPTKSRPNVDASRSRTWESQKYRPYAPSPISGRRLGTRPPSGDHYASR